MSENKKPCFGNYENWDMSWHCKGCVVNSMCEEYSKVCSKEKTDEQSE